MKATVTPAKPTRVVRTCPRCKTNAYQRGNDFGVKNKISCVNCGHSWLGRILRRDL